MHHINAGLPGVIMPFRPGKMRDARAGRCLRRDGAHAHEEIRPGNRFMLERNKKFPSAAERGPADRISQRFDAPYEYSICFCDDAFASGNPLLRDALAPADGGAVSFICFVDSEVLRHHPQLPARIERYAGQHDSIGLVAPPYAVQGGESCKNDPGLLHDIYEILLRHAVDRHNWVVAIGGGAVLDLVGYAAATAHRGIRLLRLPTTVLAQNDSGVGVKNGINFQGRKNYLGTFTPPDAVICDFSFLQTLPERERRAGMAEAVKVSLIRDDAFFRWLERNSAALAAFEKDTVACMVRRSAEIHAAQISGGGDPFEKGSNRPLDYGHWLAHKLEALSGFEVRHGEAVAIGMLVDARYSYEKGLLSRDALDRIRRLIEALGFELWHAAIDARDERGEPAILQGLDEFREHLGGELSVTLLGGIGLGVEVHEIDGDIMRSSLDWTRRCQDSPA
jgi:3-dehydroquinate synthase